MEKTELLICDYGKQEITINGGTVTDLTEVSYLVAGQEKPGG